MWITVQKAAELLNQSERAVQLGCQRKKYACRCIDGIGRGGKQYEVLLESLPGIARMRYYGVPLVMNEERPNGCSGKQWSEAEHKVRIVVEYQTSGLSVDSFIEWYNENFSPEKPLNRQRGSLLIRRNLKKAALLLWLTTGAELPGAFRLLKKSGNTSIVYL